MQNSPSRFILPPIHKNHENSNNSMIGGATDQIPITKQRGSVSEIYEGVNQILVWSNSNINNIYYIPAYLRIQVNRVNRIDYVGCVAEVDSYITLWLMIKQLPILVRQEIINNGQLKINGNKGIKFRDILNNKNNSLSSVNTSKKVVTFHLKETLTMQIETKTFLSPFQVINLLSTIELRPIKMPSQLTERDKHRTMKQIDQNQKPVDYSQFLDAEITFNMMKTRTFVQFSFGELRNLGTFDLAENQVGIRLSNDDDFGKMKFNEFINGEQSTIQNIILPAYATDQKKKFIEKQAPNTYQNAKIVIALYKYPMTTIINVFVPFYLLSLLSLGVFFQPNDFSGRSISIFMLLTSYMAMIPGIRSSIPPTPSLIMIQIIVYFQTLCIVLIFAQSLSIKQLTSYEFLWYDDTCFMIVMGYTIINFMIILVLCIIHKCCWQKDYNKLPEGTKQSDDNEDQKINTDDWYNNSCQNQFKQLMEHGQLRPLHPSVKKYSRTKLIEVKNRQVQKNPKDCL